MGGENITNPSQYHIIPGHDRQRKGGRTGTVPPVEKKGKVGISWRLPIPVSLIGRIRLCKGPMSNRMIEKSKN
jgi:hypothetical protein